MADDKPATSARPDVTEVRLAVTDMEASLRFYTDGLGLSVSTCSDGGDTVEFVAEDTRFVMLRAGYATPDSVLQRATYLDFLVPNLQQTLGALNPFGVIPRDSTPRKAAIGVWHEVTDPDGIRLHLMELDKAYGAAEQPTLFNVALPITNLDTALTFYRDSFGFGVHSEAYWPPILPLAGDGADLILVDADHPIATILSDGSGVYPVIMIPGRPGNSSAISDRDADSFIRDPFGNTIKAVLGK